MSSFAVVSFILGVIALVTIKWWFICLPAAILSIVVIIWGHKLGGAELNMFGIITSLCAVGLCIIFAIFSYVGVINKQVNTLSPESLEQKLDIVGGMGKMANIE